MGLYLLWEHQRVFPIQLLPSSECGNFFTWQFSFTDSFETQVTYMYCCSFKKSDKYSSAEVSLSSVPLFSSSEALVISYDSDIFVMKIALSWKFVGRLLSLLEVLYKNIRKPLAQLFLLLLFLLFIFVFNTMTSRIIKKRITFYIK